MGASASPRAGAIKWRCGRKFFGSACGEYSMSAVS